MDGALMGLVGGVLVAEVLLAALALEGQEVEALARAHVAVAAQVRELHHVRREE